MTFGPRTLHELEAGPNRQHIGSGHCTWTESHRDFARRVALIAHAEGFAAGARAQRDAFVDVLLEVSVIRDREEAERLVDEAMQRAAPLVGE